MQRLELLGQFIKLYGDKINTELVSLKYCQTAENALIEMFFSANPLTPVITNLEFITGDIITSAEGIEKNLSFFDPNADIVDNAGSFIQLGEYSLINCFDNLFTEKAEQDISKEYFKNNPFHPEP